QRQRAPLCRDALDRPPELNLGFEQAVAFAAVLVRLAGEADLVVCRQESGVYAAGLDTQRRPSVERSPAGGFGGWQPPCQQLIELVAVYRLGGVVVHSGPAAFLTVARASR